MSFSIRKVFFNLQMVLLALGAGVTVLMAHLFHISQYSDRLSALKNQHLLIEKITNTDMSDPQMGMILINGALAEIALSVKLSGEEALLDTFFRSNEEQASLLRSLEVSSQTYQDNVILWARSDTLSASANRERMMAGRSAYLADIDRMLDYQINIINGSIATAKTTAASIFVLGLFAFLFYRTRLNQIYHDIHKACSVDVEGSEKKAHTHEVDFILKQLSRRASQPAANPNLLHPVTGLYNEKGLINALNAKKGGKTGNTVFVSLFEIDNYAALVQNHTKEEIGTMFKQLGETISLYEQPLDVIAHMDDDRLVFVMSRSSKKGALDECEHIVRSVGQSTFMTSKGMIQITLSAGFLLKAPIKTIEEVLDDAAKLIKIAQENGGNRVAQLRENPDAYRSKR